MKTFWKIVFGSMLGALMAIAVMAALGISLVGSLATIAPKHAAKPSGNTILRIGFATPTAERGSEKFYFSRSGGASLASTISLYSMVRAIDAAASDDAVSFIYITPDMPELSMSQAEEVRAALGRFRNAGKAVVSYCNTMYDESYYLASVADRVMFNPCGEVMMVGTGTSVLFFKDALDKLGIDVQLIRHGKYKSAGESFVRSDISGDNLEQNRAMVRSLQTSRSLEIAASRGFSADDYNRWIDNLELTDAESLLSNGLVDQLCHLDSLEAYLCQLAGEEDADDLDIIDIEDYAASVSGNNRSHDKIAVVYCDGELVTGAGMEGAVSCEEIDDILERLQKDSTVKAVVLRVNSPGGSALGAEMINHRLSLVQEVKPVIASYGDYAASGGYWISARADKIYTDNTSLTGSIGAFSLIPSFGKALKGKLGVNVVGITSNSHGGMLSMIDPLDEKETAFFQKEVERVYSQFTALVADGRSMSESEVDNLGQGRVWTGKDAIEAGLADACGGLVDAIAYAEAVTGLTDGDYRVVEYPVVKTAAEKIMESISQVRTQAGAAKAVGDNPLRALESAYSGLRTASRPQVYARMPYVYLF